MNGAGYEIDGRPLHFFHFSGYDPRLPNVLSKHQDRILLSEEPALERLCGEYGEALLERGFESTIKWPYSYAELPNGLPLTAELRELHRRGVESGELEEDVFTPAGAEAFLAWLNQPQDPGRAAGMTRYLHFLYEERPDLQEGWPHLEVDAHGFMGWAEVFGRRDVPVPEQLLAGSGKAAADGAPGTAGPERPGAPSRPVAPERPAAPTGVNLAGFYRAELGIGEVARQIVSALDTEGVPVAQVGLSTPHSREGHRHLHTGFGAHPYPVNLICVNADGTPGFRASLGEDFFRGRYSIGVWWWEVSRFPERFAGAFEALDEVWTGSTHVADAVSRVSPLPVVKVTMPVELPEPPPVSRAELGLPEGFVFLYSFDFHSVFERKNPLALVEAFGRAFEPGDGPQLVLKSINGDRHLDALERLRMAARDRPDIHVVDRYLPPGQKDALTQACDCYVSLHRAEGFGLTMAEAMYLGKPVIGTAYSGNLDFMNERNSYLVGYELVPIGAGQDPYPAEGEWAEPDTDQAAQLMRRVVENPAEARERAERGARDIRRTHSAEAAGRVMAERLVEVESRLTDSTPEAWKARFHIPQTELGDAIVKGPVERGRPRFGRLGSLARRLVLRLMKPFTVHQASVDTALLDYLRQVEIGQSHIQAELRGQDRRLSELGGELRAAPYMSEPVFEGFEDPRLGQVYGYRDRQAEPAGSQAHRGFQDLFRGSEEFIRERQRTYLALLSDHAPVLDLGCGRGELLDLLAEAGIEAVGVDSDAAMVERCRAKGHEGVVQADAVEYLADRLDGSLGAIFSSHLIEHLPHPELLALLDLARAKLRPGGLLIAETPNPHSIQAMKAFWVDLTHQRPIFPEAALALCRLAGFAPAFVFYPNGSADAGRDRHAEGEYTVVATRPEGGQT